MICNYRQNQPFERESSRRNLYDDSWPQTRAVTERHLYSPKVLQNEGQYICARVYRNSHQHPGKILNQFLMKKSKLSRPPSIEFSNRT